jgi:hypothetical protein
MYNSEIHSTKGRSLKVYHVGREGEGRKDFNSSPLGYPTRVKTTTILTENFEFFLRQIIHK